VASYRRLPSATAPIVLIILAVFLGNFIFLSGLEIDNPITWTAGISHFLCHVTCGRPMIDPNVGYITQAMGHRSALDLLHGHLPWWNYFEGLGQPLAGEMQAASLFPLTLLFALSSGLLWFHICLEVIAGVSTYFLARRLSIPIVFATCAGMLFALNGTFAWLGNAVLNPVAFLPMLLLGIEMIYDGARTRSNKGWYVAAIALALSLYAGFPEVAYLDGLFCAGWAIVRFFSLPKDVRSLAAKRVGLAALVGGLLSLPGLIPFYDFLKVANVGSHNSAGQAIESLPVHALPMFFDPYVYGTIFSNPNVGTIWGPRPARALWQGAPCASPVPRDLDLLRGPRSPQHPQGPPALERHPAAQELRLRALHHAELRDLADRARRSWHHGLRHEPAGEAPLHDDDPRGAARAALERARGPRAQPRRAAHPQGRHHPHRARPHPLPRHLLPARHRAPVQVQGRAAADRADPRR
jgi:hypothetical protein